MRRTLFTVLPLLAVILTAAAGLTQMDTELPQVVRDPREAFVKGSIVVKGEGAAPAERNLSAAQKRIMALRAAKVIALRETAEILDGVAISGETLVVNAAAESDDIRATVDGIVKGAAVIRETYDPLTEMAVVYVQVPLTGPNGIYAQLLPQVIPLVPGGEFPAYRETSPAAREASYDGLILDVREEPFKPALINRVLTKNGETVYDPSKVAQNILVERGAAEYTNEVGKARALLGERGSNNPAVVRASGLVKSTDVVVTPEDASAIFTSNQANNFLEGARVVFVLK